MADCRNPKKSTLLLLSIKNKIIYLIKEYLTDNYNNCTEYKKRGEKYMISLAELNAIKDRMKNKVAIRKEDAEDIRIVVGMATCGIAAGARPVLLALTEEIESRKLEGVRVVQAGCIGICQYEPVVEVFEPGKDKVTYVRMDAKKAKEVIDSHIINGKIIAEYSIGAVTAQ